MEKPAADDLAITINAFGNLMQTTMPLFKVTLAVTDAEFKEIAPKIAVAGVGLATALTAGGLIYFGAAAALGPIGLVGAAASVIGVAFGTNAAKEGAAWKQKQQTDRKQPSRPSLLAILATLLTGHAASVVLLAIQKTVEECAAYLLCLLVISTEEEGGDDAAFHEKVLDLRSQVSSNLAFTPK